jgi:hypothetical protein
VESTTRKEVTGSILVILVLVLVFVMRMCQCQIFRQQRPETQKSCGSCKYLKMPQSQLTAYWDEHLETTKPPVQAKWEMGDCLYAKTILIPHPGIEYKSSFKM